MFSQTGWSESQVETLLLPAGDDATRQAVDILSQGGCVALPTETVYGLAADGLDARAAAGIFEAKGRPLSDPLILHVPAVEWLERLGKSSEAALRLADRYWPGPLTLVLPRREVVPDIVTAGQETVAIRMSAHPVMQTVVTAFGRPLAAPSANRFGRISPTQALDVLEELGGRIPLIVDGGACQVGIESTIVLVQDRRLRILRQGPVTADMLLEEFEGVENNDNSVVVPGSMKSHYAPKTRLRLVDSLEGEGDRTKVALQFTGQPEAGFLAVEVLSAAGDFREAAANLYRALRRLDGFEAVEILAERVPAEGLGLAILDRLERAATKLGVEP